MLAGVRQKPVEANMLTFPLCCWERPFCGWVAITPSAGYVTVGQSIFIAFVITLICNVAVYWRSHTSIDDALDVFPTHGTGGIFGTVLTGIFIQEGLIDRLIPMRVSVYSEKVGLDYSQHDEHYGLAHVGEREIAEYEEHIREKELKS